MHSPQPAHHERIAITGMALVNALGNSVTEVWENSQAMRSGVRPVRLLPDDPPAFVNPQAFVPGSNTYCGVMGLINIEISRQDLKLPPQDFRAMSASTRLTLLMASKVIEESGLSTAGYDPQRIGVFVSQNSGESASTLWDLNLTLRGRRIAELAASVGQWTPQQQEDFYQRLTAGRVHPDESTMLCRLNCTAAGLVCQHYGFAGPSFSVGAACSSSMAALYTAYTLLQAGVIDAAVVGGGEEIYAPLYFAEFSALGALARASEHITNPEDYSRPFDLHRNGFVLGEGAAMVVLEKRHLAHKRSAPVHGLIASMGNVTNNVGLVEPSAHFQAEAIRRSFAGLDYGPEMVDLVECHATATPQGDIAEAQSLLQCFGHKNQATVLSGYKGQVGHTTGASGIISLIHGLCAMRSGTYPGTLNCPNPDPALQLDKAQLRVLAAPEVWPSPASGIRRMQINTFGFGGSCFVAQVEEDNDRQSSASLSGGFQGQESIVDGTRLITLPHQGRDWRLASTTPLWMQELAGLSKEPTQEELASLSRRGLWLSPPDPAPSVAIMCCGQGSVWPGMGRALYDSFPAAREAMDRVARAANWDILALMDEPSQEKIILTRWQQPYLFLLEYAQASYLQSLGLKAKVMSGHSLGELIALCLAGVYTPESAWTIMETRATFMAQLEADATHETSMMSVHCTAEVLEATLKEWPELHVSNYNSPMQVILSGTRELLLEVRRTLRKRRIPAVMLGVSMAFHHPHMRSLRDASLARLERLDFHPATLPMMSNITTGIYPDEPAAIRQYIADLDENSVRWVECVRNMWNIYGIRDFVEMGPTDILCGLVSDIEPKARCVASSRKEREVEAMRTAVARLYAMGHLSVRPGHGGQPPAASRGAQSFVQATAPNSSSPATASSTPSPQVEAHIEAVMPIIALATGYTREELQPDMDLRHDLAIRSSRFPLIMHEAEQQFHITLRFEDMLGVATIRDLADVLRRLQAKTSGAADSDNNAAPPKDAPTDHDAQSPIPPLLRYAPRLQKLAMAEAPDRPLRAAPTDYLLLVGSGPCAKVCAEHLGSIYTHSVIHNCATVQEALAQLKDKPLQSRRSLVLALDSDADNAPSQAPASPLTARLTDLFLLVQAFCKGKDASFCLCVQQGIPASALLEGLNGLLLAAALEYPACMFRTACVGQEAPASWLAQCLSHTAKTDAPIANEPAPCHPLQWIFDQGQSYTLHLQPVALDPIPATGLPLRHGDIIVVPGGARGISPYALTALAPLGCTLVLLGRSPHGDTEPLEKLRALGATVQHKVCDVTNPAALTRTIGDIVEEFGRVDGLLYTAGITRDATMDALSAQDFTAVLAVKCQGLEQCLQATAPAGLRYAVAFSSLAAWLGNYGQANYCAANRAMTALLHSFCLSRNIASRAVWLPPLDGHGMAAGTDMREQMRLRAMDHAWIQCEELGELLARELFCATEADIVWARILPAVPHVSLPVKADLRALVGLFERPERFPLVYPVQAASVPEGLFTGGHHFSHYGDTWLKDAAPVSAKVNAGSSALSPAVLSTLPTLADSFGQGAHAVPTAMLVECMVESALQNCPWLQSYAVHDLVLHAPLVCTGGISRESLITSQSLPWETKSDTLFRICNSEVQVYNMSANGRQQHSLAPLCQGRIVLAPAPPCVDDTNLADRAERESLWHLQALWDVSTPPLGTQQAVETFYRASGLGPYWQLLTDTNTVQQAGIQAGTQAGLQAGIQAGTLAWAKDLQAKCVFPAHTLEALLHTALMVHTIAGGSQEDRLKSIASIQFCTPSSLPVGKLYLTVLPVRDHSPADGCFDGQVHDEHGTVRMIVRKISFAA